MERTSQTSKSKKRKVKTVKHMQKKKKRDSETPPAAKESQPPSDNNSDKPNEKQAYIQVNSATFIQHIRKFDAVTFNESNLIQKINQTISHSFQTYESTNSNNLPTLPSPRNTNLSLTTYYPDQANIGSLCSFRCYVEDFMLLERDECVLVLIPVTSVDLVKIYNDVIQSQKRHCLEFNSVGYYVVAMHVHLNPAKEHLLQPTSLTFINDGLSMGNSYANNGCVLKSKSIDMHNQIMLSWKQVFEGKKAGIQVWKKGKSKRNPYNLMTKTRKAEKHVSILGILSDEMFGDISQVKDLLTAYYKIKARYCQNKISLLEKIIAKINQDTSLEGDACKNVLERTDSLFEQGIIDACTKYSVLHDPIISHDDYIGLVDYYKEQMPAHYEDMKKKFSFGKYAGLEKNKHLLESRFYDKILFSQFLSQARVKNPKNCIYWAMVPTVALYARGITQNMSCTGTFFGSQLHYKTCIKKLSEITSNMVKCQEFPTKSELTTFVTMDNNQKGFPVKNPRYGQNNKFVTVTGRTFVQYKKTIMEYLENYRTELTFKNQAIVSALKQPHFEKLYCDGVIPIESISNTLTSFEDVPSDGMKVDITGERMQAYIDLVVIAYTISTQRKYVSGHNATTDTFKRWKFQSEKHWKNPLRSKTMKLFASLKKSVFLKLNLSRTGTQSYGIQRSMSLLSCMFLA